MFHLVIVGLVLGCVYSGVHGWGPVSHYYFARQAFPAALSSSLKQSVDFPDGTYFANWSEFPNCNLPVDNFHNAVTAGYFYQFAVSSAGQSFKSETFDPVSFALGYGSHMIADAVGFYPKFGYLGTVPSWVTFFPFMTAIDSLVTTLISFPPNEDWGSTTQVEFIAAATTYYNSVSPSFPAFNSTTVANCAMPWADTDVELVNLANLQASTGYYKSALVFYDRFNATTFDEAQTNFKLSNACAVNAIQYWGTQIASNVDPATAYLQHLLLPWFEFISLYKILKYPHSSRWILRQRVMLSQSVTLFCLESSLLSYYIHIH